MRGAEEEERGRRSSPQARAAAVALATLLLLAVVALAAGARGGGSLAPAPRAIPDSLFDYLFTFGVVMLASLVLLAFLVRRPGPAPRSERGLLDYLLVIAMSAIAMVAFWYGVRVAIESGLLEPLELPEERGGREGVTDPDAPGSRPAEFRTGPALVLAGLVLAAVGLHLVLRRRRRASLRGLELGVAEELAVLLDDTLDDLRDERDARRAVIAAYARMELALAAHGLPRRPSEAPLEYLARVLAELRVPAGAVLDLTALFERAKFSPHPIDAEMKDEAISALVTVRDDLRAAA